MKHWDRTRAGSLAPLVAKVNAIRNAHPALQSDRSLAFHPTDSDQLLCYSKHAGEDRVLVVANLDPQNVQTGWVDVQTDALGLPTGAAFTAHDELTGAAYPWRAGRNFVRLDPAQAPAHVFTLARA